MKSRFNINLFDLVMALSTAVDLVSPQLAAAKGYDEFVQALSATPE